MDRIALLNRILNLLVVVSELDVVRADHVIDHLLAGRDEAIFTGLRQWLGLKGISLRFIEPGLEDLQSSRHDHLLIEIPEQRDLDSRRAADQITHIRFQGLVRIFPLLLALRITKGFQVHSDQIDLLASLGTGLEFEMSLKGWSWEDALIVLGIFTVLQGFSSTFLAPNLNGIVGHVQEGTLDFVLLKPISSQFWLSTRTLSPWGLPDLVFGGVLIAYAG